jgi:hypothetical protein
MVGLSVELEGRFIFCPRNYCFKYPLCFQMHVQEGR